MDRAQLAPAAAIQIAPNTELSLHQWRMLSDDERALYLRVQRRGAAYRTVMCKFYAQLGLCRYGDDCRFAHTIDQLRVPKAQHPKYKTVLCRSFAISGYCRFGAKCLFIHRYPSYPKSNTMGTVASGIPFPPPPPPPPPPCFGLPLPVATPMARYPVLMNPIREDHSHTASLDDMMAALLKR